MRADHLSLDGLRARRSASDDDPHRHGVSPALSAARAAARLRPHSTVWLSREPLSDRATPPRPALAPTHRTGERALANARMALSAVWRADGPRSHPRRASARARLLRLRHVTAYQSRCQDRDPSDVCPHAPVLVSPLARTEPMLVALCRGISRRCSRAAPMLGVASPRLGRTQVGVVR